ncbi:MAG: 16S rRNA (uracil(1498)-N(3))-methyltransferase [Actinomycetota bacterium]|nr:16S rRNA (uracil(1498)-N(3))-methyltransferase [Actinomycetota bacterium]
MTAPRFLAPAAALAAARDAPGSPVVLEGAEARHAAVVRRLAVGERVDVSDGLGTVVQGTVTAVAPDRVEVLAARWSIEPEPSPRIVVVQALAKGDRSELAVEVLTEVGVDVIVPWQSERAVVQWRGDRGARALERWRSTAREAGKQARRARLPVVAELAATTDVAVLLREAALGVVLHEDADLPLVGSPVPTAGDVVLVVGPEGGISDGELSVLGPEHVRRLGPHVLRTSTAGAIAVTVVTASSGRW